MARYIDAVKCADVISKKLNIPLDNLVDVFAEIPTADVAEVKHGEWLFDFTLDGLNFYRCSVCGMQECLLAKESTTEYFPYCHCGAKMDGGNAE